MTERRVELGLVVEIGIVLVVEVFVVVLVEVLVVVVELVVDLLGVVALVDGAFALGLARRLGRRGGGRVLGGAVVGEALRPRHPLGCEQGGRRRA